jgi:hypothetical protein
MMHAAYWLLIVVAMTLAVVTITREATTVYQQELLAR